MGTGKKKIEIKIKATEEQRMVAFSKRRKGLFKKISELHCMTGAEIAVIAFSPASKPYTHGEPSFNATMDRFLRYTVQDEEEEEEEEEEENNNNNYDINTFKSLLDGIQVEVYWETDELLSLKQKLEEIYGILVSTSDE